ncbi:MAG: hypothetical protein GY867_00215, partial [bacterium]|nr:hypothetical protein [bacterium]
MPHVKLLLEYLSVSIILLAFCGACTSVKQETRNPKVLSGYAENLWSERIDLGDFSYGMTIINPFSPSVCGYCLIDGEFIKANYFRRNQERGGHNLFLSPFSPQLDNYTFLKHYREDENTTLAFPPSLRDYHPNGYPWITIFQDGQLTYGNVLSPYDGVFDSLKQILWPEDNDITMRLTTPTKLSNNLIYESATPRHVSVVANGEETVFERLTRSNENRTGFTVKHEKDLTPDDFAGNVSYVGKGRTFGYDMLKELEFPCKLDSAGLQMGSYVFPFSEFGFRAIMPNPYSPENYLILNLWADGGGAHCHQWTDFTVSRFDSILQEPATVLDGFFDKSDPVAWKFTDSLTTTFADLKALCPGGVCLVPFMPSEAKKRGDYDAHFSGWSETDLGCTAEFGNNNCRFPSIAAGTEGQIATVWEEDGDIIMALTKSDETPTFVSIERELSDSFDPSVIWDGE